MVFERETYSRPNENNIQILKNVIEYCRNIGLPQFWIKEDSIAQNKAIFNFIDIALEFDYIFTICDESFENYMIKRMKMFIH